MAKAMDQEVKDRIIEQYKLGRGTKDIAKEFNCRYETVCKIVRLAGVSNKNGRSYDGSFEKMICEEYSKGFSMKTLGDKYNLVAGTILNILERNGYDKREKLLFGKEKEVVELYLSGLTLEEVGLKFDVSPQTVGRLLNSVDVQIRTLNKFTQDKEIEICEFYKNNDFYMTEVAEIYNCSDGLVYNLLIKHGYETKNYNLTNEQEQEICKKYLSGSSLNNLIFEYRRSDYTIKDVLVKNNIDLRNLSEANKVYDLDVKYFDDITQRSVCYHLGWFYSDGNVYNNSMYLGLQENDKFILETFVKYLKTDKPLEYRESVTSLYSNGKIYMCKPQWSFRITNEYIANRLKELGCIPKKSLVLKFPDTENLKGFRISDFIRGYLEGDGCVCFKEIKELGSNNRYTCSVSMLGTKELVLGIKDWLVDNGLNRVSLYKHSKNVKNTWILFIGCLLDILKFKELIYDEYLNDSTIKEYDLILDRKYNKLKQVQDFADRNPDIVLNLNKKRILAKKEIQNEIIEMYSNKTPVKDIALKFNCSGSTICNILRKNNIFIESSKSKNQYLKENKNEISNMINDGISLSLISKKYNVNKISIRRLLNMS